MSLYVPEFRGKIFSIDIFLDNSKFYYDTSYYFYHHIQGPCGTQYTEMSCNAAFNIAAHTFIYRYIFYQKKGRQSRKLPFHFLLPLNSTAETSHLKCCFWADAALEIGAHLELSELRYKLM